MANRITYIHGSSEVRNLKRHAGSKTPVQLAITVLNFILESAPNFDLFDSVIGCLMNEYAKVCKPMIPGSSIL